MKIRTIVLPQFFPKEWCHNYGVHGIDFIDLVCLGFVTREEGRYSFILHNQLGELDVAPDELSSMALQNLSALRNGVQIHIGHPPGATVLWITAEDNFASVRLLLPKVQEEIRSKIGDNYCFTIPSRDVMLIWNHDAPDDLTQKHLHEAREDYENEEYNLSPYGYIYSSEWPCRRLDSQQSAPPDRR